MSVQALTWALKQKTGSATLKAVLIAVANYADERGKCWPSQERLASDTEMSERSIRTALKSLEEQGFLTRTPRYSGGNRTVDTIQLLYRKEIPVRSEQEENEDGFIPANCVVHTGKSRQFIPEGRSGEPSVEPSEEPSVEETRAMRASHTDFPQDAFETWYEGYPHKVGRLAAERAFERARKSGRVTFPQLIEGRDRYVATKRPDVEWCNPASWLDQGRWDDQPAVIVPFPNAHQPMSAPYEQQPHKSELARAFARLDEKLATLGGS